jgi:hypothetical protein
MAGTGYKLFATGDVLTAAQVNTYLMQQTVMVFASSAARTSALSGVLAEGMVSYLQDTNTLEVYDGAAWVGATGDITGLTAGTGISISSATGPVPTVAIDTATTVDKTTAQTLTNKTLTSPVLTTPSISNIEAKGDILVGTADNTLGVITAGSNGETLVADSSATTGLRYTAGNVIPNPIINSAFQVWQRGTSFTNGNSLTAYGADRWQIYSSNTTGRTWSRQATNDTTNLPSIQYCQRLARNSGDTQTGIIYTIYNFETLNSIPFAGKTVTISYYARAGANYSSASNVLNVGFLTGTGTDQNSLAGYTGTTNSPFSATLTTTWQRFTHTVAVGATATEIGIQIGYTPVGTAGANDWFELTGVQMDIGSVALPFRTNGATIQGELAACQRYYWRTTADTVYGALTGMGTVISTTLAEYVIQYPVQMRTTPSSTIEWANLSHQMPGSGSIAVSALAIYTNYYNKNYAYVAANAASGLTAGKAAFLAGNNNSAGYIGISAEL